MSGYEWDPYVENGVWGNGSTANDGRPRVTGANRTYTSDMWKNYGGGTQPRTSSSVGMTAGRYGSADAAARAGSTNYANTIGNWQMSQDAKYKSDLNNYLSLFQQYAAPQTQAFKNEAAILQSEMGTQRGKTDLASKDLTDQINAKLQLLAVDRASGGDDLAAADRQQKLVDEIYQLNIQRNDLMQGKLNEDAGFAARNRDLGLAANDNSVSSLTEDAKNARNKERSDAVVRGAYSTEGHRDVQGQINKGEELGREKLGIDRQGVLLDYDKTSSDIQANLRQTYLDRDELGLNHTEQVAAIEDRRKVIFREAQKIGISEEQYQKDLENGLALIQLNNQTSMNQLLSAIASNNAKQAQAAMDIANQAAAAAAAARNNTPGTYSPQEIAFYTAIKAQQDKQAADLALWNAAIARNNGQTTAQQGAAKQGNKKMAKLR